MQTANSPVLSTAVMERRLRFPSHVWRMQVDRLERIANEWQPEYPDRRRRLDIMKNSANT